MYVCERFACQAPVVDQVAVRACLMIEGQEGVSWDDWAHLARLTEETGLEGLFAPITTRRSFASTRTRSTRGRRSQGWRRSPSGSGSAPRLARDLPPPERARADGRHRRPRLSGPPRRGHGGRAGTNASTWRTGSPSWTRGSGSTSSPEQVEIVVRSWTEESFDHDGTAYELRGQTALPSVSLGHPPLVLGEDRLDRASRRPGRPSYRVNTLGAPNMTSSARAELGAWTAPARRPAATRRRSGSR